MSNNNLNAIKKRKSSIAGSFSVAIAVIVALLILNFLTGLIPIEKIQGLPMFMPFIFCPIGVIIGLVSYRMTKDKISLYGFVLNLVVFLVPFVYNFFGTLIFGI